MLRLCALTLFLAGTAVQAAQAAMTPLTGQVAPGIGRGVAPAQVWPLGSVTGGYAVATGGSETCYFNPAPSSFITGPVTYLQLTDLEYYPPGDNVQPAYTFYGPGHLTFTSATSGTITFDNFNSLWGVNQTNAAYALPSVTFSGYSAVLPNTTTLQISFNLTIGNCTVPFSGTYHQ